MILSSKIAKFWAVYQLVQYVLKTVDEISHSQQKTSLKFWAFYGLVQYVLDQIYNIFNGAKND